ncbi:inorganic pyrophosphatase isoform X2 [Maniola hyperantus]|uniref:inorganic pyrophosphatase isoform X2 n=1 Tax=Aphantopus hyperantus TaxID=2795564 RepID=UPI00374A199C
MSAARWCVAAPSRRAVSLGKQLCRSLVVSCARPSVTSAASASMYVAEDRGSPYSPDYRVYFKDASGPISPLHDIPLWADRAARLAHMVVEVPRWSNAKMELSLAEPLNPIRQDVKSGALRYVANVFPHHGYIWNYGALPQTWEDPRHVDAATRARGDNDPVDVIEIGARVAARGDVLRVKLLGVLALIDEGETDWKLLAIDARDPAAAALHGPADVEARFPGLLRATVEWFRLYKDERDGGGQSCTRGARGRGARAGRRAARRAAAAAAAARGQVALRVEPVARCGVAARHGSRRRAAARHGSRSRV